MSRTNTLLFGLLATATLALAGACGRDGEAPHVDVPAEAAAGNLRLWLEEPVVMLDPNLAEFSDEGAIIGHLFRGLLWYDQNVRLIPMAAREVPSHQNGGISRDGTTFTFRLKEGLKWSDGQSLTAADFEYSFKRVLDPTINAPFASLYADITGAREFNSAAPGTDPEALSKLRQAVGVKARDELTLVITLTKPRSTFLDLTTLWTVSPIRHDLVERYGNAWTDAGNLVGNGPFRLNESSDASIVLEANPFWSGTSNRLAGIIYRVIPDGTDALNAYLKGDLDVVGVDPEVLDAVDGDLLLKKQNIRLNQLASVALMFNNSAAPFDDVKVRQAFSMAIDRARLIEDFQRGTVQPGLSWIPPGMPGFDKNAGMQWDSDPEKARQLLSDAGYAGGGGLAPIVFIHRPSQVALAASFRQQIEENLGVKIVLEQPSPAEYAARTKSGGFGVVSYGWIADYPEVGTFLSDIFSCQSYAGNKCTQFGNNIARYANPDFDRIQLQASKELDKERRLKLYREAQRIMISDAPAIFIGHPITNVLVKPYVQGLVAVPFHRQTPGDPFFERIYIESK